MFNLPVHLFALSTVHRNLICMSSCHSNFTQSASEVMHAEANSVLQCSSSSSSNMQLIHYILSICRDDWSRACSCNISAVPEVVMNGGRGSNDISVPWPASQHSLLCELTGSDGPELKVVNQYLQPCQLSFPDRQLGVKKTVLPLNVLKESVNGKHHE